MECDIPPPNKRGISAILGDTLLKTGKWVRYPSLRYYLERVLRDRGGYLALGRLASNPWNFIKSIAGTNGRRTAVQIGGVLQYKLEVYCDISLSRKLRSQQCTALRMGGVLRFKLEMYWQYHPHRNY